MTPPLHSAWLVLDTGPGTPAGNMAIDDALLEGAATTGRPVLRHYAWSEPAATFGYFQRHADIAAATQLRPLIRRPTGGGLVPHARDWTYSVVIPPGHPWFELPAVDSYRRLHDWLRRAFAGIGIETILAPCCDPAGPGQCFVGAEKFDLLAGRRKVAGAAQRRNKLGLLIQGSVQPPMEWGGPERWKESLRRVGSAEDSGEHFEQWDLPPPIAERAAELAASRYGSAAYNERR